MRILCTEQGTPEWHKAKSGKFSASCAQIAMMGDGTKGRRNYIEKLADDLEGIPNFDDEDDPPWFRDGRYYESWARGWYAWEHNVEVGQTGFVVHDDYDFVGCSPDGLVGDDGLIEIKYRKTIKSFKDHAQAQMTRPVIAQIQTQIWVCNRKWCDYVNYWRSDDHEKEMGHSQRIYRDDAYIGNVLVPAIVRLWSDVRLELRRRGTLKSTLPSG